MSPGNMIVSVFYMGAVLHRNTFLAEHIRPIKNI